jgi:hypothetical protein
LPVFPLFKLSIALSIDKLLFTISVGVIENMEIATEMNAVQSTEKTKPLRQSGSVSKPLRKPVETSPGSGEEQEKNEEAEEDTATESTDPVYIKYI